MHIKRILTALIGTPIVFLFFFKANYDLFAMLVLLVSLISLYEYFKITLNKERSNLHSIVVLSSFVTTSAIVYGAYTSSFDIIIFALVFNLIGAGSLSLFELKTNPEMNRTVAIHVQASIYIPLFLSFLIFIRGEELGVSFIILLFLLVGMGDTGAYYIGKIFGKRKLIPWVSPNKTVEGFVGGLIFSIGTGCVYKYYVLEGINWIPAISYFVTVAIFAPLGDLFESSLKRAGDIKDSGNILPGHGGMLDRIDALLFAIPVTYFFMKYIF